MMNKVVERLMNNVIIRRNLVMSLNCTTSQCCLHFSQAVRQLADNYKSNKNELDFVNSNNNYGNITKSIGKCYKDMNVDEVIATMNMLYKSLNDNEQLKAGNVEEIEGFKYMCNTILKNARTLNTYNTIRMLHILLSFHVSPNSVLIQTLLQLISVSVNKLTVGQIMMLHAILYNIKDTPIVKALVKALPIALLQQAKIELDIESTNLVKVLRFCSVIKDVQTKKYIINLLAKTNHFINPIYIVDIFYAIYTLPELCTSSKNLLIKIYKIILANASFLKFKEIETLLHYISIKVLNSEMDFYNEEVINRLCTVALNNELTFNETMLIAKHLNNMHYSNIDLLYHLLKKCSEEKHNLQRCSDMQINHLIKALVLANYKVYDWKIVEDMLLNRVVDMQSSLYDTASMAVRLLSLDCYCPELLNKVFTMYNLCNYLQEKRSMLIVLKLHWWLKLFYPQYEGPLLDESKLNQMIVEHESNNMPYLRESIEEVVGESKYVKSNLITKFGESVDYAIVMQQDGSFMNIKNYDITFAEEFDSFSECRKILFFGYPKEAYCINTQNLLPTVKMSLKAIETLTGFYTFVINPFLWEIYSWKEKIAYLQKGIKLRCTNISSN